MEGFAQDLRFAARSLARRPGFTLAVVATLALAIGANTAVFSLVDAALLRELPFPEDGRLVSVWSTVRRDVVERRGLSYPDFAALRAGTRSFSGLAAVVDGNWAVTGGGAAERLTGELATEGYLEILGLAPVLGRTLGPAPAAEAEAVISHGLWYRRFGGDPAVLGATIRLDDTEHTVVGVMPPGFEGVTDGTAVWTALEQVLSPEDVEARGARFLGAVGRLVPGASIDRAGDEVAAIAAGVEREHPDDNTGYGAAVGPLRDDLVGDLETPLLVLFAAVGFVLLIACVNVANLMLVRASGRRRESAVHAALGAGRGRMVRRAVAEALLLGLAGGAAGVELAVWGLESLLAFSPVEIPSFLPVGLDLRVLGFCLALTLGTAVGLGAATGLRARPRLAEALTPGDRSAGGSPAARRTRSVLVAAEVALALVLLVGAGLMVQSFLRLRAIDPGFDVSGDLLFFRVDLSASGYGDDARVGFRPRLVEALEAVPGVERAVLSLDTPLQEGWGATVVSPEGTVLDPAAPYGGGTRVYRHVVEPGFFEVIGLPLIAGRDFTAADVDPELEATPVIVGVEMARRTWSERSPQEAVGRRVKLGPPSSGEPWMTVIGVAGDVRYRNLVAGGTDTPDDPDVFFPLWRPANLLSVSVRGELPPGGDPVALVPALRDAVARLEPAAVVFDPETPATRLARQRANALFTALLMAAFSLLALTLAAIGVYGVLAYAVAQRTREIGVRMALGARARAVLALVLRQGMVPVAAGAAAGVLLAAGLTRLLESLLYEVGALDPGVFAGVTAALLAVALAACLLPARRASRVDPTIALRHE